MKATPRSLNARRRRHAIATAAAAAAAALLLVSPRMSSPPTAGGGGGGGGLGMGVGVAHARVADRGRVVAARKLNKSANKKTTATAFSSHSTSSSSSYATAPEAAERGINDRVQGGGYKLGGGELGSVESRRNAVDADADLADRKPIEGARYYGWDRRSAEVEAVARAGRAAEGSDAAGFGRLRRSMKQPQDHADDETPMVAERGDHLGDPKLMTRPSTAAAVEGGYVDILNHDRAVNGHFSAVGENDAEFEEYTSLPGDFDPSSGSYDEPDTFRRRLSSQLTGCCSTYTSYSAQSMCNLYKQSCNSGDMQSHDSGDASCSMAGLSFIGISFSVNTAMGNPYSYQLCDQYPMENIIDRDYSYVMSMDEDGWLVGGGYKSFDFSGKMPYIDSSHTELLRIGSIDPSYGGTTIEQVYSAMNSLSFPPFSIFPEYVKGGGGHHSGDKDSSSVPSGDVTLIVSVVETYEDNSNYSTYQKFLYNLFNAMDAVGGGPCMDDHDTDPHVSMARGVKFKSSYHQQQYFYKVNLEVAVWQAMYPKGVVIGTSSYANFPPEQAGKNRHYIGYGNLYFFFDRANITTAFAPNRGLTSSEQYYSELYNSGGGTSYYSSITTIGFDYSGSGSGDKNQYYEHNPYSWNAKMAKHDMTDGWDLPPNCNQEGETFFGIPLSRSSKSKLQSTSTFQEQFDFEYLLDRNYTYIKSFGTNHGWLIGEILNNGPGSIVDKDTAHIPIFYTGTTNADMGGMSLSDLVKIAKMVNFGTLYIKPAFVFQDDDGSVKLQFEADANSALGYLYDNLCKMIGIAWNYEKPYNDLGVYTNCAMHAAGDRAKYGCGPENANTGGFCPQMTLAYRVRFQSNDHAAAFFYRANNYVDYWRSLYPTGVAVGTSKFCPEGGCLGLFLNRMDIYNMYKPDGGGSWVEFNGGTFAPTISPAPTWNGGCDDPHNSHLDRCFRKQHKRKAAVAAWDSLGTVGQVSVLLISFMASTLAISIFLARARKKKRSGESYVGFFVRDMKRRRKKKKKLRKKSHGMEEDLMDASMFSDENEYRPPPPPRSGRSSSKSAAPAKSSSGGGGGRTSSGRSSRGRSRSKNRDAAEAAASSGKGSTSRRSRSRSRTAAVAPADLEPASSEAASVSSRSQHSPSRRAGGRSRSRGARSRSRGRRESSRGRSSGQEREVGSSDMLRKSSVTSKRRQLV